jgi:hypothetical protein
VAPFWAMGRLAIAILLLTAGCGIPPLVIERSKLVDGPEGWEKAEFIACEAMGSAFDCPPVYWYGPDSMTCLDGGGFPYDGDCIEGVTGSDGILIGRLSYEARPHRTAMTHELAHWFVGDYDHSDKSIWGGEYYEPTPGTLIGDITIALDAAGL